MENDELLFDGENVESIYVDSSVTVDDVESFADYTEYFRIDDICEDEDGEPMELNF